MNTAAEPIVRRWLRRAGVAASALGGPQERHRARARVHGFLLGREWEKRCRHAVQPVVIVALVEHMGDIVAAEPISRTLRRDHPDARIGWVVKKGFAELVASNPHIDFVIRVNCLSEWISMARRPEIAAHTIDLHVPGRACDTCHLRLKNPSAAPGLDITNYYVHGSLLDIFCKCGGLVPIDEAPRVYITPPAVARADALQLPARYVAVHCQSNQSDRDWTAAKWHDLARRLRESGIAVVEVGLKPTLSGESGSIDVCGRLGILETAEVIRRAALYIGIDSGPAHLANAVGTPGVILLGHYRAYARYVPYSGEYRSGRNATLLTADGPAAALEVERVWEAAAERLAGCARGITGIRS